jgi:hypothetical protein
MNQSPIVPFGKYKGQPVEVLASDPQYVEWLLSQSSIKLKYPDIINVIINNFQVPSETPEHNALQVKFLNENYRIKFAAYVSNISKQHFDRTGLSIRNAINQYLERHFNYNTYGLSEQTQHELALEKQEKIIKKREEIFKNAAIGLTTGKVEFEKKGLDVEFYVGIDVVDRDSELSKTLSKCWQENRIQYSADGWFYSIEIKPVVSDDFPAVLRQMKLSEAKILFVSEYTGIGATKEEFIKYFKTQDITVVFESDIDNFIFENNQYYILT